MKPFPESGNERHDARRAVCSWGHLVCRHMVDRSAGMLDGVRSSPVIRNIELNPLFFRRRKRYRLRPRSPLATASRSSAPGVSILRPLKGLDTNLYENLESTFTQEYPNFEILFSVADEDDQALSVVRDLVAKYPNVQARIIIGAKETRSVLGCVHRAQRKTTLRGGSCRRKPESQQSRSLVSSSLERHRMGVGF